MTSDLSDEWKLSFTGSGKTETVTVPKDWSEDSATLHYSGEVVYSRDFTVAK